MINIEDDIKQSTKQIKTIKDKKDRATCDKVLDNKTIKIIQSLEKRGVINDFSGCFSSGKEANVYLAKSEDISSFDSKFLRANNDNKEKVFEKIEETKSEEKKESLLGRKKT